MGEHKEPRLYDFILHLQRKKKKKKKSPGECFFHSPSPSSSSISPLSAALSLSIPASFYSIYSYSTVNHLVKKKRVSESEGGRQREIRRLQMEVVFFFSCSYPSAFEPAMWKSARSTALHSSLPLIKSRQSGLNQHAKCHSTL